LTLVLTAFNWSRDIVADRLERGHGHMTDWLDLVPSECGTLVSELAFNRRFNRYCEDRGLSPGLDIHSLIWPCFVLGFLRGPGPGVLRETAEYVSLNHAAVIEMRRFTDSKTSNSAAATMTSRTTTAARAAMAVRNIGSEAEIFATVLAVSAEVMRFPRHRRLPGWTVLP
jgi:hypothetical protein